MKRNDIHIIYSLLCTLLLSACIKNDIPYPRIKAQILGISADGQIGTAAIDNDKRMVTMELSDTVDLRRVHIETLDLTEGAVSDLPSDSIIDLLQKLHVDPLHLSRLHMDDKCHPKYRKKFQSRGTNRSTGIRCP